MILYGFTQKKMIEILTFRVLVADVLENNDGALRSIIKIAKKSKKLK